MTSLEIGLGILIIYLFIGTILWIAGLRTFGGIRAYREFLDEQDNPNPVVFIFLIFIVAWPFFLRRR